jgi:hypothetical protein
MLFLERSFQGNQGPEGDFMKNFAKELDILAPRGNYRNLQPNDKEGNQEDSSRL